MKNYKIINKKKIEDKYLWLSDKKKAKSHIDKANKQTLDYFNKHNKDLIELEIFNTNLYSNDLFEIEYKKKDFFIKEKYGSFLKTIIYLKPKNKKNYKILLDLNETKYKDLKFLELIDYTISKDLRYFIYLIDEKGDERFKLYINRIENDLSLSNLLILNDINSYTFISKHDLLFVSKAKNKIIKESDISRRILFYDIAKLKKLYNIKNLINPKLKMKKI